MRDTEPAVIVEGLQAGYWLDEPVLDGVDGSISGAGAWQLQAKNGVGKSTLFEVLAGYLVPTAGSVSIAGHTVRPGRRVRGLRLQRSTPALVPGLSLRDQLHLMVRRYGSEFGEFERLASALGLDQHLDKPPEMMSTGTVRKAWFLCNAVGDEPVWCLDEPFNGVDIEAGAAMCRVLSRAAERRLVIVTTHQLPNGITARGTPLELGSGLRMQRIDFTVG